MHVSMIWWFEKATRQYYSGATAVEHTRRRLFEVWRLPRQIFVVNRFTCRRRMNTLFDQSVAKGRVLPTLLPLEKKRLMPCPCAILLPCPPNNPPMDGLSGAKKAPRNLDGAWVRMLVPYHTIPFFGEEENSEQRRRRSVTSILGNFLFSRIRIAIHENTLLFLRIQEFAHLHSWEFWILKNRFSDSWEYR